MPHGNKPSAWGPGAYELASLIGILDTRAYPRSTKKVYKEDVIWLIDQILQDVLGYDNISSSICSAMQTRNL